jgi:tetratricopeptide (TPR) repeat protein
VSAPSRAGTRSSAPRAGSARRALGVALAALAAAAVSGAGAAPARADTPPSAWDRARDPYVRDRYDLHVRVVQLLLLDGTVNGGTVSKSALEHVRAMLEDADAAHSPDPRLRFDLGSVYEDLKHHEKAAEILQAACDAFPNHSAIAGALEQLAYAYAYMDRSREERATYLRLLPLLDDGPSKAVMLLNLAEAEMHLGNLPEAVARYRESVQVSGQLSGLRGTDETYVLAVWGLAVALDRAGDPQASREQTKLATEMDVGERTIGGGTNVFFVPAYERDWYLALAQMLHAEEAPSAREALEAWTRAVEYWNHYVTSADPGDRWVVLARSHLSRARQKREKVAERVAKEPPAPPPPGHDDAIHVIQ